MKSKIAAGLLLLLLAVVLWIRGGRHGSDVETAGGRSLAVAGEMGAAEAATAEADSKSSGRKTLRENLPPGAELQADEVREASAKGNVRLFLEHETEFWADRLIAGTEEGTFLAEGRVVVWSGERKRRAVFTGGPVTLKLEGGRVVVKSSGGMQSEKLDKQQEEEEMTAFRDSLKPDEEKKSEDEE